MNAGRHRVLFRCFDRATGKSIQSRFIELSRFATSELFVDRIAHEPSAASITIANPPPSTALAMISFDRLRSPLALGINLDFDTAVAATLL